MDASQWDSSIYFSSDINHTFHFWHQFRSKISLHWNISLSEMIAITPPISQNISPGRKSIVNEKQKSINRRAVLPIAQSKSNKLDKQNHETLNGEK